MKSEPKPKRKSQWTINESQVFSYSEFITLTNYCEEQKKQGIQSCKFLLIRNWFMVNVGLYTGLRVDEMRNLKISDLSIEDEHSSVNVRKGKGGKKGNVLISSSFKDKCNEYISCLKKFNHPTDNESYVFVSLSGKQLTTRALQKSFKKLIRLAGLPEHFSVHCLRHTYGTYLLKASGNIKLVQEQMRLLSDNYNYRPTTIILTLLLTMKGDVIKTKMNQGEINIENKT